MKAARLVTTLLLSAAIPLPAWAGPANCADQTVIEGCELWTARYNSGTPALDDIEADFGNDVGVSPDGATTFVTGRIRGLENADDFDLGTVAYDAESGEQRWFARYAGGSYYDFAQALAVDPSGERIYVAGATHGGAFDMVVIAYRADTGQELWTAVVDGTGFDDLATAIQVSDDGRTAVVTGESWKDGGAGSPLSTDMLTVAIDTLSGEELWRRRHDAGGPGRAQAVDIGPDTRVEPDDPGPAVVVTGPSAKEGGPAAIGTVAYDLETGEKRWEARLEAPTGQEGRDLEISPDGRTVVIAGNRAGEGNNLWDYVTVAYDVETGAERWQQVFDGASSSLDQVSSMAMAPDGSRAFVTGVSWDMRVNGPIFVSDANYLTFAYDVATGDEAWRALYDGGFESDDVGTSIAPSPDGTRVYVSGHSRIPGVWTYATVALRADTGAQEWAARLGGTDGISSEGPEIAVGAAGRVFVTGAGLGPNWYDILSAAYEG